MASYPSTRPVSYTSTHHFRIKSTVLRSRATGRRKPSSSHLSTAIFLSCGNRFTSVLLPVTAVATQYFSLNDHGSDKSVKRRRKVQKMPIKKAKVTNSDSEQPQLTASASQTSSSTYYFLNLLV